MQPSRQVNYFRIGTFVIIGITILIIGILILGSGMLFKKTVYIETYFNDTIQGLSVGSSVKYRGLDIGHVKKLNLVKTIYHVQNKHIKNTHKQYIYCLMAISPGFLANSNNENDIETIIKKDVQQGLRVKMALQGLTGTAYLEVDFLKPQANPSLPIEWKPEHYYIPSATSTLTRFSDNVQYILDELKKVKFDKIFDDFDLLINATKNVVQRTDNILMSSNQGIINSLDNFNAITENLRIVTENAKAFPSNFVFGKPPQPLDPNKL